MRIRLAATAALLALATVFATSPVAKAEDAIATDIIGDHTGDFKADLVAVNSHGELMLWESQPNYRMVETGPYERYDDWSSVTAIVQYDTSILGRTDVLIRRSNGGLYDHWSYGRGDNSLLSSGTLIGRNWNGIDAIIPIPRKRDWSSQPPQLIARNRYDMRLYLYDWKLNSDYQWVLVDRGPIGSGWGGMRQMFSVGNFCGDANPDLIGVHQSGILYCYALDAAGRASEGVRIGHGWNNFATAFSPGDLNGDGYKDLVGIRSDGAAYGYWNRNGRWSAPYWIAHIDPAKIRAIG